MGHLRKVSDDEVTIDILSHGDGEFRLMVCEAIIFEDFAYSYDIAFFVWYLDAHESESWDRCLDTDRFRFQGEGEIFFQCFYLGKAYSLART